MLSPKMGREKQRDILNQVLRIRRKLLLGDRELSMPGEKTAVVA